MGSTCAFLAPVENRKTSLSTWLWPSSCKMAHHTSAWHRAGLRVSMPVHYMCVDVQCMCVGVQCMCVGVQYICVDVHYMCVEVQYMCVGVKYTCVDVQYMCVEVQYMLTLFGC